MQMAQLQRHQEPSSREVDPSCKIIRLLIAPAHSYSHGYRPASTFLRPYVSRIPLLRAAQWLVLLRPAEKEGPGLAGWGEIELASEFWTEDKRLKGLVSASLSAQSEDSKVGGVS